MRASFQKLLCVIALLGSTALSAAETAGGKLFATPAPEAAASSGAADIGQVTLGLLVVLAVMFGAAWLVRRFKLFNQGGNGQLQVVAQLALGPKERAVLIKVGTKQVLIGVAPGNVRALHVLEGEDVVTDIEAPKPDVAADPAAPSFKSLLRQSLGLKQ